MFCKKPLRSDLGRLSPARAFTWLVAGWRDVAVHAASSLIYGLLVSLVSVGIVIGLFAVGWASILFPAFAGFMVVGPLLAIGLYEKSRQIAAGEPMRFGRMIFVRPNQAGRSCSPAYSCVS